MCVKVDDLGLAGEILPVTYSHVASKNRYLYVDGQLHRMPSGLRSVLFVFSRERGLCVQLSDQVRRRAQRRKQKDRKTVCCEDIIRHRVRK